MRAGLGGIQQTLTPEAAVVLNNSIAEAGRRSHGQTTPLHVAATLLSSPSGFLRQACVRSHPNSSHPLQCRALELCFSVALERLPTVQTSSLPAEPPMSNALMAALKRAQANQRRGFPEMQQQPFLALKVELEQLVISILDDPSVSRVMREASFSSPAIKSAIEQSLTPPSNPDPPLFPPFRPPSSSYLNPLLQPHAGNEDISRLVNILLRPSKRNPIIVGDSEAESLVRATLMSIEMRGLGEGALKNAHIIPVESTLFTSETPNRTAELESMIASNPTSGIILDLSNLKWLVEQAGELGRTSVMEIANLLKRFKGQSIWLIGSATCETYLKCKINHPSIESDWDLQAVPRVGKNGMVADMPSFKNIPEIKLKQDRDKSPILPPWLLNAKPNQVQKPATPIGSLLQPPKPAIPTDLVLGRIDSEEDSYKKLVKVLTEKVWWQRDAAAEVAKGVSSSKGKWRVTAPRTDTWLILRGPDMIAKKTIASVVSNLLHRTEPITLSLKSDEELFHSFRGRTPLDLIAEEVRRNPFSVILIEDFDLGDALLCGSIKHAIERGRIVDSRNREVGLGNVIFLLSADSSREEIVEESVRMTLRVCERGCKRRAFPSGRFAKLRRTLDLNETAEADDDGSYDSSDLTVDNDSDSASRIRGCELGDAVDCVVLFRKVDLTRFTGELDGLIRSSFCGVFGGRARVEVEQEDLERLLSELRVGRIGLGEWVETVLRPSFVKLRMVENTVVRLEPDEEPGSGSPGEIRVIGACNFELVKM